MADMFDFYTVIPLISTKFFINADFNGRHEICGKNSN